MLNREQTPAEHAQGVASSKDAYLLDGEFVYISSRRRQRHLNRSWGYYDLVIYRPIFRYGESSMPLAQFFKASQKTGKTVEMVINEHVNPHDSGYCCRYANGETCIGCGDAENGEKL